MLRLVAQSMDNYVARKFAKALYGRNYTTTPAEMAKVQEIVHLPKDDFFLLNTPLPVTELQANFKEVAHTPNHIAYCFSFTSPHPTEDEVNNRAYGKYYQSKANPHGPTVLILPGWMTYKEEKYYTEPLGKMLLEAGINYIFYSIPYHIERTPRGTWSGELAISGNLLRTIEAFRQATIEARTIINWLKTAINPEKIGILGVSLGGWIGSNLLHLPTELDFAILVIPAVSPTAGLWETRIGTPIRKDLEKLGMTKESYERLVKPVNPLSYPPTLNVQKIQIVRAKYDQCVPGYALEKYCQFLGRPQVKIYRQGHFSMFRAHQPIKEMIQFIRNES